MKNTILIITQIFMLFLVVLSCQDANPKVKNKIISDVKNVKQIHQKTASKFSGNFATLQNGKEIFITLISDENSNSVIGVLLMDGKKAQISVMEESEICTGKITEEDTQKQYAITLKFIGDKLNCAIVFPEFNNQILSFILSKSNLTIDENVDTIENTISTNIASTSNQKRNPSVVGKWRFTEVLSSGSGEFYASFSTDYFLQIFENGTCITWTGKSAGGTNDAIINSNSGKNLEEAQWHTSGKNIIFINPSTKKEISIPFYAEQNTMMLKGNVNRVYQRIN